MLLNPHAFDNAVPTRGGVMNRWSSVEIAADGREVLQEEDTDGSRCVVTVHQTAQTPNPKPRPRK